VSSRKESNVESVVSKLKAKGYQVIGVPCHVSNAEQRLISNFFKAFFFLFI